jgi:EAL domain-containing protein (putative c-di-GMP-specific phosphodiesterase class I)
LLRRRRPLLDNAAVHFTLRVENFDHVRRAYGEDIARTALGSVHRLLNDLLQADGIIVPEMYGTIEVLVWNPSALGVGPLPEACRDWLDTLCRLVPLIAVETALGPVHLWLKGGWLITEEASVDKTVGAGGEGALDIRFLGDGPGDSDAWAERYRADMALASKVLTSVAPVDLSRDPAHALMLFWQPVRDAQAPDLLLYHEALLRLVDGDCAAESPSGVFLALERLGFVRIVDQYVVSLVIDELEASPDTVIGVNISARSVRDDAWWNEIWERLKAAPALAHRLVVEITETAAMPDISAAVRFASGLRRLGCRIALDDFGTGFASIRQLLALSPDIVKIDRLFLRRSLNGDRQRATLKHLIALARSLDATVVVEGVETDEQAQLALDAGGDWQQGYHWGRPALSRIRCSTPARVEATDVSGSAELLLAAGADRMSQFASEGGRW